MAFLGQLRLPGLFLKSLGDLVRLRAEGRVGRVLFVTWPGEVDKVAGLSALLNELHVELLVVSPPALKLPGHMAEQMLSLQVALDAFAPTDRVLKTRTDLYLAPGFVAFLAENPDYIATEVADLSSLGASDGSVDGLAAHRFFDQKVWIPWFEISKPFYLADETFLGWPGTLRSW